jgi:uncharacterized SAM-binding protein YcdF (DUF218 family)
MNPARRHRAQRGGIILKLLCVLFTLLILAGLYLLRGPILRTVGGWYVVDEPLQPADAIVVLGDDNYLAERAARAAELYHQKWAPRIVASGRHLRPYATITQLMQKDLADRGVPAAAIVPLPSTATNTLQEARVVRDLARREQWTRLLVVTSNFHTRRTRFIYSRVFSPPIEVRVAAARDSAFDPERWWQTRSGLRALFMETVGLVVAAWETRKDEPAPPALMLPQAPAATSVQ